MTRHSRHLAWQAQLVVDRGARRLLRRDARAHGLRGGRAVHVEQHAGRADPARRRRQAAGEDHRPWTSRSGHRGHRRSLRRLARASGLDRDGPRRVRRDDRRLPEQRREVVAPRHGHDRRRPHRARRRAAQGQLDADRAPVQRPRQPTGASRDRFARQVDEGRPSEDAVAPPVRRVRARSALPRCQRARVADRGRLRRRLDPAHGARRQPVDESVRRAVSPDGRRGHELQPVRRGLLPARGAPRRLLGSADVAGHEARHPLQGDRRRALPVRGSGSRELHEGVQPAGRDARHRAAPDDRFPANSSSSRRTDSSTRASPRISTWSGSRATSRSTT